MDETSETLYFEDQATQPKSTTRVRQPGCATMVVLLVSVVVLIVGIVLIIVSSKRHNSNVNSNSFRDSCRLSPDNEGTRLKEFLTKIKRSYFRLHPNKIYTNHVMKDNAVSARNYKAYNPKPSTLKTITDTSRALYADLIRLNIDSRKLKPRERKALSQAKHYLRHTFGQPYGVNYYAGDWMLGPNQFCMEPLCKIKEDIRDHLLNFKPHNLNDLNTLREVLKGQADGIDQYVLNMKQGVKAGMVRTIEECQAGVDAIKENFPEISLYNERGVLRSKFVNPALKPDFISKLLKTDQHKWSKENSLTVEESIRRYIVQFIGKPIVRLIRYLENDYIRHCVPSSVSSGLASLPLDYEYLDKVKTDIKTTKMLPTGELLNGSKSYEMTMSFFTTTNITPEEVNELGHKQLKLIYPKALEIARNLTKLKTDEDAVKKFRELRLSQKYQFSQEPFPDNESDAKAHKRCSTIKGARQFCPKRWEATEKYWSEARMVMSLLISKAVSMFYFNGEKLTVPICPVQMAPNLNPSIGIERYGLSDVMCSKNALFYTPFFLESFRPRYEVWSITAHETVPGHHTQLQGLVEHFKDNCNDVVSWLSRQTSYTAFVEGWALYAENPLISETDIYDNNLMEKYGMLKAKIWRALRLIIDTGLHNKGLTRNESLALFDKYAWDNSDIAKKEVTRYQNVFGQATAYMIGQLRIKKLRDYARKRLGDKFNLKEFHYQVLSQGGAPLPYLTSHIHKYVDCALHDTAEGCDLINTPLPKRSANGNNLEAFTELLSEPNIPSFNQLHYF